jgi:predicted phage terminase large subunit-like protein
MLSTYRPVDEILANDPEARAVVEIFRRRKAKDGLASWCEYASDEIPANFHRYMLGRLEAVERGECRRLMIFMPPGHAKSTYASARFPAWFMGRRKNIAVICASHTLGLAEKFSKRTRDMVGGAKFKAVFDFGLAHGSTGVGEWSTDEGGEYFAVGVGGALPGRRGDLIIIDDPVSGPEAADSPNDRQKVFDWYLGSVRPRMKPGAAIVLIMQRWNEGDLAGKILPETWAGESGLVKSRTGEMWEVISFPAAARGDDVLGRQPGEWLWPEYYPPDHYEMERSSQSPRNWSALYQQQPAPDTGDFFERDWLKFYPASQWRDWRTKRPANMTIIGASDYAARETTGDYTVHGVFGLDPEGAIYVLDWWRKAAKPQEWSDALCDLVLKWNPRDWLEEKGPIAAANEAALRDRLRQRRAHTRIIGYASTKQKEVRAGAIRTLVQDGRVLIPNGAPWADDLIMEMMKFPASRNDDQVDVLSLIGRHIDRMPRRRAPVAPEDPKYGLQHVTMDMMWKLHKPSQQTRLI